MAGEQAKLARGLPDSPFRAEDVGDAILTAFSDLEPHGARVFMRARGSSERAFRRAARHSRHVRMLRIAVPALAVLAIVVGTVLPQVFAPLRVLSQLPVDLGSVVVSGSKIMMQQPRIAGFTRENRRYDLTAQAAGQDLTKPDLVELRGIHATLEQDDGLIEATARDGLYNSKTELLTLSNDVKVNSASGLQAVLSEAVLDTRAGKITSEKPVVIQTPTVNVNANRMEVSDGGEVMRFEQGVVVLLLPKSSVQYEAKSR
jgi:lipopolysaccharide export system protein LptC